MDCRQNLKQPFSRLPIFQRVEMIAPTLLKAILKRYLHKKVFENPESVLLVQRSIYGPRSYLIRPATCYTEIKAEL